MPRRSGRACRRPTRSSSSRHPNLDPAGLPTAGFDVVADPGSDMNDWLAAADILVTDYSSSIYEWALLRRPLVLLVDDLEAYERDPGLYLDYRTEMIGVQVRDTGGRGGGDRGGRLGPGRVRGVRRPATSAPATAGRASGSSSGSSPRAAGAAGPGPGSAH